MGTNTETDKQTEPCLTPNCNKQGEWKGLCRSCYGQALQLIKAEKTTWAELQDMGMAAMSSKPFMLAFLRKKNETKEPETTETTETTPPT